MLRIKHDRLGPILARSAWSYLRSLERQYVDFKRESSYLNGNEQGQCLSGSVRVP